MQAARVEQSVVLTFIPLDPGVPHPLRTAWNAVQPDLLRVAAAFGTEAGAAELRNSVIGASAFDQAEKEWLIGVQSGVTQPEALRRLASFTASAVRIPFGSACLASPTLRAPSFFHSKAYYLENRTTGHVQLLSSSGNLTFGGLRANVEQFLAWTGMTAAPEARRFNEWWAALWAIADVADDPFRLAYETQRPVLPTPPGARTSGPPKRTLQRADSFWIELTRKPEGGSFNQVELLFNGHFFFYPDTRDPRRDVHRPLSFEDATGTVFDDGRRQIMFNGPPLKTGGNSMWRVYMPTAKQGFIGYQDGDVLVRFERTGTPDRYIVEVAPSKGPKALEWIGLGTGVAVHAGTPPRRMGWS